MATSKDFTVYDDVLSSILVKEESILGFLSAIFNFLARRTDFYYISKSPDKNLGFPPGVAEQLVVKVVRACDPSNWMNGASAQPMEDVNNEIMCSTVAQEVEIVSEEISEFDHEENVISDPETTAESQSIPAASATNDMMNNLTLEETSQSEEYIPPTIPTQKNSETYNGSNRGNYSWSQTIMELDLTVKLPADTKSSKDLKVVINASDILVQKRTGEIIIQDSFPYKVKACESFWSISEGKLVIHLEKAKERWWKKLLNQEEEIDLDLIDCSRPLDELPDDHIDKVRELQWNQQRKLQGLPTSDELRNMEKLKRAWNTDGSPFKGTEFNARFS